jgi:hypothetical protein
LQVFAGDKFCGKVSHKAGQNEYIIECDTIASRVKVINPTTHLTLCEVKVFGFPDPIDREYLSVP